METTAIQRYIQPLVENELFTNEEEAIKELVQNYVSLKISELSSMVHFFENKYKMSRIQFQKLIREEFEVSLLTLFDLDKKKSSQLLMQHEDDLQDWSSKQEILNSWMAIQKEMA